MNEKETRDPIQNEASNGLPNEKYTVAMARTSDPHSASAPILHQHCRQRFPELPF